MLSTCINTLRQACDFFEQGGSTAPSAKLKVAFDNFIKEKESMRLATRTIQSLRSNVGRFISGREEVLLSKIRRDDLVSYLQRPEWGPRTYNSYLISLKTFFIWCHTSELIAKNPTVSIKLIGKKQMTDLDEPPAILSTDQCARLLRAALEIDRGIIPYIAVGAFGGLRPMREAGKLLREDIEAKSILVRAANAKDRQRRYVDVHPTLLKWLKIALKSKAQFPPKNLRRRFEAVRARAGLIKLIKIKGTERKQIENTGWEQDCLRHTFASHYLPVYGAEKTIVQLGHGNYAILFDHYRRVVSRHEAEKFWRELAPEKIIPGLFDPITDKQLAPSGVVGVASHETKIN